MPLTARQFRPADHAQSGFGSVSPASVAAAQRAGLGRGLAAVLVLAVSCLLVVYAPLAWYGPAGLDVRAVAPPPRESAVLRLPVTAARILR